MSILLFVQGYIMSFISLDFGGRFLNSKYCESQEISSKMYYVL